MKSIEQTGAWEVTVHMKRPDVIFPGLMATPAGGVGPQAYVTAKGKNYGTAKAGPVGTGPFKFTSWNPGLEHHPQPQRRVLGHRTRSQDQVRRVQFHPGGVDDDHRPSERRDRRRLPHALQRAQPATLVLSRHPLPRQEHALHRHLRQHDHPGPLANSNVLKALLKATDRQALAKTVYSGAATPLPSTMTPLGQWSYAQSQAAAAYQKLPPPVLDLEGAKKLMQGVDTSGTIVIATRASFQRYINIATIVQDAGKKLGLNIQIKPINPNDYGDLFFSDSARKGIDLFISENYADIPEPLETLYITVTPQPANALTYNYNDYNNPTVTSDLRKAVAESDPSKRASSHHRRAERAGRPARHPAARVARRAALSQQARDRRPSLVLLSLLPLGARRGSALTRGLRSVPGPPAGRARRHAPGDQLHRLRRRLPRSGEPAHGSYGRAAAAALHAERDQPSVRLRQAVPRPLLGLVDGVIHGDFGQSVVFRQDVSSLITPRIGTTVFLIVYAALLILLFGVALGPRVGPA